MSDYDKHGRTNWRAMQVPPRREPGQQPQWTSPGDVNVRAMGMGSWKARVSKGGKKA